MAFSVRMHISSYLLVEHGVEINAIGSQCHSLRVVDPKRPGLRRSHGFCPKNVTFSVSLRAGTGRWKKNNVIVRSELEHPMSDVPASGVSVESRPLGSPVGVDLPIGRDSIVKEDNYVPVVAAGGDGGNGRFPPGGGGGGGGGGGDHGDGEIEGDDGDAKDFGRLLSFEEVMKLLEARGVSLPSDMYEAAKTTGIRKVLLENYLDLLDAPWLIREATKSCSLFRDRMLVDRSFLFKVVTEIVIDSCCATFAEVQKRGKDFWSEFELFAADLLVGVVVDIALVGLLAPYARFGKPSASKGLFGRTARAYDALPSSVFEAERPGCRFSVQQRIATYFCKGILYGSVGFACGLIGQGIANLIMMAKRSVKKSEEDIPVPPLIKSAALWGVFLAVSSNTRYQIINGLERVVEASPVAKRIPPVAMAFTVGLRFSNNIYGGMQFVDWARWSGCQ